MNEVFAGVTQHHYSGILGLLVLMRCEFTDENESVGPRLVLNFNRRDHAQNYAQALEFELVGAITATIQESLFEFVSELLSDSPPNLTILSLKLKNTYSDGVDHDVLEHHYDLHGLVFWQVKSTDFKESARHEQVLK